MDDLNKAELEIRKHRLIKKFQEDIYTLQKGEQSNMQAEPTSLARAQIMPEVVV